MENASKALIIAAGMLISVIIVTLFVYEMVSVSNTAKMYKDDMERAAVLEFNQYFEAKVGKLLKAQDIVTICGYIAEYNKDNPTVELDTESDNVIEKLLKDLQDENVINNRTGKSKNSGFSKKSK